MNKNNRRAEAILEIHRLIAFYEISAEQLLSHTHQRPESPPQSAEAASAPSTEPTQFTVRYRDAFGNSWDGEGPMPMWLKRYVLAGQSAEFYRVDH